MTGTRLLPDDSSLQQQLVHIIWTNSESPVSQINNIQTVNGQYLTF